MTALGTHHPKKPVTWAQYAQWAKLAFNRVRLGHDRAPAFVTGPARGGLIVAVLASHHFNAKYIDLSEVAALDLQAQETVLWCDDIADTGITWARTAPPRAYGSCAIIARAHMRDKGIAAGHYITAEDPTWFVFPYESADAPAEKDGTV